MRRDAFRRPLRHAGSPAKWGQRRATVECRFPSLTGPVVSSRSFHACFGPWFKVSKGTQRSRESRPPSRGKRRAPQAADRGPHLQPARRAQAARMLQSCVGCQPRRGCIPIPTSSYKGTVHQSMWACLELKGSCASRCVTAWCDRQVVN